ACMDLNRRIISGLGIVRGMTHCEMYLTPEGPLFGEIALRPPGGYIMELLSHAYDMNAWDLVVNIELEQKVALPPCAAAAAGAWILHPGHGRVVAVRGREQIETSPAVIRHRVKVAPGHRIAPRGGTGDDVGYVIVRGDSAADVLAALMHVEKTLI